MPCFCRLCLPYYYLSTRLQYSVITVDQYQRFFRLLGTLVILFYIIYEIFYSKFEALFCPGMFQLFHDILSSIFKIYGIKIAVILLAKGFVRTALCTFIALRIEIIWFHNSLIDSFRVISFSVFPVSAFKSFSEKGLLWSNF